MTWDFRQEAAPFHVWNKGGVHELVCDSYADLHQRKKFGQRPCTDRECDWCRDVRLERFKVMQGGRQ